jgi:ATP-dependent DNA helicase RecQ
LFDQLRNLRRKLAEKSDLAPYLILHDEVLKQISRQLPASPQELGRIRGIGKRKLQQFGGVVLEAVRDFRQRHPSASPSSNTHAAAGNDTHWSTRKSPGPTAEETWQLWKQGKTLFEIADARGLTRSTVTGHLLQLMAEGRQIDLGRIIPAERRKMIEAAIAKAGNERLKPIKELLPEDVSYEDIRLVIGDLQLKPASR